MISTKKYLKCIKILPELVGGCVHKDEKHEYYDPNKKEYVVSGNHMHLIGACITQDGRCHTSDTINPEMCKKANALQIKIDTALNSWE